MINMVSPLTAVVSPIDKAAAEFPSSPYLKPIPELSRTATALDYHQIPIETGCRQNGEPLVNVRKFGIAARSAYAGTSAPYYRAFNQALNSVYVRSGIAARLVIANEILRPFGAELLTLDGWRPIQLQQELWQHFIEKGQAVLLEPTAQELVAFAGQYCSNPQGFDPEDFRTWPVHATGGAIDVTLRCISDRQELFMGAIFDDADSVSSTRFYEDNNLLSQSAVEARRNRRLLYHAMTAAGFVNYPHEWWHFDYGTQMWVMNGEGNSIALYGLTGLRSSKHALRAIG